MERFGRAPGWIVAALWCGISLSVGEARGIELASATMSPTPAFGGPTLNHNSLIGWRFSVDALLLVEEVGGHLIGLGGEIFAAVVRLDAVGEFPTGTPFAAEEVVATALLEPPQASIETYGSLPVVVLPGVYALVFGSGQFGADGSAAIPNMASQTHIPPTTVASYMRWSSPLPGVPPRWMASPEGNMRFVIRGIEIGGRSDFDVTGEVGDTDLAVWAEGWGMSTGGDMRLGDADGDGAVAGSDFLAWQRELGSRAPVAVSAVPEPATWGLVLGVVLVVLSGRAGRGLS